MSASSAYLRTWLLSSAALLIAGCAGKSATIGTPLIDLEIVDHQAEADADTAQAAAIAASAAAQPDVVMPPTTAISVGDITAEPNAVVITGNNVPGTLTITVHPPPAPISPAEVVLDVVPPARGEAGTPGDPSIAALRTFDPALGLEVLPAEGYSAAPYELGGEMHVCYGHLLDENIPVEEWTDVECAEQYGRDLITASQDAENYIGADQWQTLSLDQQVTVGELAFVLGSARLAGFEDFRAHLIAGNLTEAQAALWDSCLPNDVKDGCQGSTPIGPDRTRRMADRLLR